ncbi:MAG TPA: toll/interleukin-1 receptor domain-containing protein [Longimicrobium sp.]|nr:toll/interleukin-1 receptor domain-containing protein [Longimicrobium sp.]
MANREHIQVLRSGPEAWNHWRSQAASAVPDLSGADLRYLVMRNANLRNANLRGADLRDSNLRHADLRGARLDGARLYRAFFSGARLRDASFKGAVLYETVFADVDLSSAIGLDACLHKGASVIDHRTLARSPGLPLEFLRGCGLPDEIIAQVTGPRHRLRPYSSCFLSYASHDQGFTERLYADLQEHGVRCWFAPEDLPIGERIRTGIDESIRKHDRLLLILSRHSVVSDWVEQEVETALARERDEKRPVLFPIRLDDAVMTSTHGWPSLIKNTKHIGDFREWQNPGAYAAALKRLLRDLQQDG